MTSGRLARKIVKALFGEFPDIFDGVDFEEVSDSVEATIDLYHDAEVVGEEE
jgi:hypothetical protein